MDTEKFRQRALWSFIIKCGNKLTDIYLRKVSVSESIDVLTEI